MDPQRALGRWSGSAVREILSNPKYTGYMVWNRRATKKGGKNNPPSEWIWSPRPTHEPLVTKDLFQAATTIGRTRQGSRTKPGLSTHPQTSPTYPLRSYLICEICDRRMHGKSRSEVSYYACEPDMRHHKDRRDWYASHPKSLWVREDDLLDLVHEFFAERVFSAQRLALLRQRLPQQPTPEDGREDRLRKEIRDLEKRQDNLMIQIEGLVAPTRVEGHARRRGGGQVVHLRLGCDPRRTCPNAVPCSATCKEDRVGTALDVADDGLADAGTGPRCIQPRSRTCGSRTAAPGRRIRAQ
ncbi:recombinase family protein [Nonomuraea basaltis]|uniref:recombinase family protein n=1 Tax=Nonomuraea basaltis TaxID=2495887 RepID=UPI001486B06F|nr:recombinase family protein [Nonomuraea basaltis]